MYVDPQTAKEVELVHLSDEDEIVESEDIDPPAPAAISEPSRKDDCQPNIQHTIVQSNEETSSLEVSQAKNVNEVLPEENPEKEVSSEYLYNKSFKVPKC